MLRSDESPTEKGPVKSWRWTFVAGSSTVFTLRTTQAATVLQELLTDAFNGVVNCDQAKMYRNLGQPQWCWAHRKRDFQACIDLPDPQVQRLGRDLMRPTKELFRNWSRCRDGTITRRGFQRLMQPIRQEIDSLPLRGAFGGHKQLVGMCDQSCTSIAMGCGRSWTWRGSSRPTTPAHLAAR